MKATEQLHDLGQSLWLDNITRELLTSGTLKRYIDELSVTGLTSNPTIFDHAITHSSAYDEEIRRLVKLGHSGEDLFFELALEDLTQAAEIFAPVHERTAGVDGWVSLEVSPLLAYDAKSTVAEAKALHKKARRPNLFIKIPGTKEGAAAIEEAIFSGVPVNVTLLFSREHYLNAADAYMRGLERRLAAGLSPDVRSVASLFISRWDKAIKDKVPADLRNKLGIAVGQQTYKAYRDLMDSDRWQRLENQGRPSPASPLCQHQHQGPRSLRRALYQRPGRSPYGEHHAREDSSGLWRPWTGERGPGARWRRCRAGAGRVRQAGVDVVKLAADLQEEGAKSFDASWQDF